MSCSYSSTESTTATGCPYFWIVTGSARAMSISKPKPFFAFPAAITFTQADFSQFEPFWPES